VRTTVLPSDRGKASDHLLTARQEAGLSWPSGHGSTSLRWRSVSPAQSGQIAGVTEAPRSDSATGNLRLSHILLAKGGKFGKSFKPARAIAERSTGRFALGGVLPPSGRRLTVASHVQQRGTQNCLEAGRDPGHHGLVSRPGCGYLGWPGTFHHFQTRQRVRHRRRLAEWIMAAAVPALGFGKNRQGNRPPIMRIRQ
jgi:hypothetical protein